MQRLQPSLTSTKQDLKEESSKQGNYIAISLFFWVTNVKKLCLLKSHVKQIHFELGTLPKV